MPFDVADATDRGVLFVSENVVDAVMLTVTVFVPLILAVTVPAAVMSPLIK